MPPNKHKKKLLKRPQQVQLKQRLNVVNGGLKFDGDKAPLDLIPFEAEEAIAQILAYGQNKYGTANWAKGINYSRLIAACLRHIGAFRKCDDLDPETNLNHIAHAATNLMMLLWMIEHRSDMDDRWVRKVQNERNSSLQTKRKR